MSEPVYGCGGEILGVPWHGSPVHRGHDVSADVSGLPVFICFTGVWMIVVSTRFAERIFSKLMKQVIVCSLSGCVRSVERIFEIIWSKGIRNTCMFASTDGVVLRMLRSLLGTTVTYGEDQSPSGGRW